MIFGKIIHFIQVYSSRRSTQTNDKTTAIAVSTWKDWGQGNWGLDKTYQALNENAVFEQWDSQTEPPKTDSVDHKVSLRQGSFCPAIAFNKINPLGNAHPTASDHTLSEAAPDELRNCSSGATG
ncbi:MAG: hypothetical protein AB4426_17920 [Xenococcaceae cyanobacterium]